ncbi:hypothetical protein Pint_30703 [Pistacia integerrima]|uniref:Uncharacterized protein n=1 Tax=Pistacia integerrima TaxID=434235 RepID=A0ACC0X1H8_9ROSI|nr:hypothetical protein Pint_30703 [Pistacia integerrima]
MAFSRTPLISFLLISLLFASSMAQSPAPAPAPTSLPPSASKTRPVAAQSPSKITPAALLLPSATSPPSPLPRFLLRPPADFSLVRSPSHRLKLPLQQRTPFLTDLHLRSWIFGGWVVRCRFDYVE